MYSKVKSIPPDDLAVHRFESSLIFALASKDQWLSIVALVASTLLIATMKCAL